MNNGDRLSRLVLVRVANIWWSTINGIIPNMTLVSHNTFAVATSWLVLNPIGLCIVGTGYSSTNVCWSFLVRGRVWGGIKEKDKVEREEEGEGDPGSGCFVNMGHKAVGLPESLLEGRSGN